MCLHPTLPHPTPRYEEDQATLRTLRMILRDLTLDLLRQKRWELFWEPEEDEEWWDKVGGRLGGQPRHVCGELAGPACSTSSPGWLHLQASLSLGTVQQRWHQPTWRDVSVLCCAVHAVAC